MYNPKPFTYKKFLQYFLQGMLILAPVTITIYALWWTFSKIDNILPIRVPGLGFVIIIVFVLLVGWISSFFVMARILSVFDNILEKTPGIKLVYGFIKDFFEAFAGNKKRFTHNVLANVDDNDVWRIGFVTNEDMEEFGFKDYVSVYIPMAYSVAGNVYIIPRNRIKPITNISATQTMKFAVSGGLTSVVEEEK